jgi:hypothetical protein
MIAEQQQHLIEGLIKQIQLCQQNKILLGKPLLQMKTDFGYSGSIYDYLDSLEPGQIPAEVVAKLSWWKEHFSLLLRTAREKKEKRRKYLERVSSANEENYLERIERINDPYDLC